MAKSHDTSLKDILRDIGDGTTQLPEFQRDWVWDDERIRALIASITCSYPVGGRHVPGMRRERDSFQIPYVHQRCAPPMERLICFP